MTQISNIMNIYKFKQLSALKQNSGYKDYIIVCVGKDEGLWYQFPEEIETEGYKGYFKEKFGMLESAELNELLEKFNEVIRDKSYEILKALEIKHNKYSDYAITDKGIILSTELPRGARAMKWSKQT